MSEDNNQSPLDTNIVPNPNQPAPEFRFKWPRFVDVEEEWRFSKAFIRRLYLAIFSIAILATTIYYYNLDPIKKLPSSNKEILAIVSGFCAEQAPLPVEAKKDFNYSDVNTLMFVKLMMGMQVLEDLRCKEIYPKVRDLFFTQYLGGKDYFNRDSALVLNRCYKSCEQTRIIYTSYIEKRCKTKECVKQFFRYVASFVEGEKKFTVEAGEYKDFIELMRKDPQLTRDIYEAIIKRYP